MAIVSNINTHSQPEAENPVQSLPQMMATENPRTAITASMQELPELNDSSVTLRAINPSQQQNTDDTPHYLALCVNKGGIYKILEEIHVPQNISDVELFKRVRVAYRKIRGGRGIYSILMAPIDIHFVLVGIVNFFPRQYSNKFPVPALALARRLHFHPRQTSLHAVIK